MADNTIVQIQFAQYSINQNDTWEVVRDWKLLGCHSGHLPQHVYDGLCWYSFHDVTVSIAVIALKRNAPLCQQVAQKHT